jgi:selenide,water dikinase
MLPLLEGAEEYATAGHLPGGAVRNRQYYHRERGIVSIDPAVPKVLADLLFDPETSGGLLFSAPERSAERIEAAFASAGEALWRIGRVESGSGVVVSAG